MEVDNRAERLQELEQEKQKISQIAYLQRRLREEVVCKIRDEKIPNEQLGIATRFRPYVITEFINGERLIVGNKKLEVMEKFLGNKKTTSLLRELMVNFQKNNKVALALYPEETIALVYAVFEAQVACVDTRREFFAEAFGVESETIHGILKNTHEAFAKLNDAATAQSIMDTLTSGTLEHDVAVSHEAAVSEFVSKRREYEVLMNQLIDHFGTIASASEFIGVHKSKYSVILHDPPGLKGCGINDLEEMIALCRTKLEELNPRHKQLPQPTPKQAPSVQMDESGRKTNRNNRQVKSRSVKDSKKIVTSEKKPVASPTESTAQAHIGRTDQASNETERRLYQQLDGLTQSLRGTLKTIEAFARMEQVPLRGQDRLELARAIAKILRLGVVDMELLNEAIHGIPITGQGTLDDIQKLLNHGSGKADE